MDVTWMEIPGKAPREHKPRRLGCGAHGGLGHGGLHHLGSLSHLDSRILLLCQMLTDCAQNPPEDRWIRQHSRQERWGLAGRCLPDWSHRHWLRSHRHRLGSHRHRLGSHRLGSHRLGSHRHRLGSHRHRLRSAGCWLGSIGHEDLLRSVSRRSVRNRSIALYHVRDCRC